MPTVELVLPRMGESVEEATILNWNKEVGDRIEADETVLEVATDKVDTEVPAPRSGVLVKILFQEGDVVSIGQPLAIIESEEGSDDFSDIKLADTQVLSSSSTTPMPAGIEIRKGTHVRDFENSEKFFSPLVRNIAMQEGIHISELNAIKGTGKNGRVTKTDLLTHLSSKRYGVSTQPKKKEKKKFNLDYYDKPKIKMDESDEIIEMDRMRRIIANHMIHSKRTSPHVSSFVEADVTNIVEWRNSVKKDFQAKHNCKLTFTPIFLEAIGKAIEDFPLINVQVDEDQIILKKSINIGMATALPSGNLIVPVIKDANKKDLITLAKNVNDLATRSRENKLKPQEVKNGTFTVSNIGTFKPAVLETPQGDVIGIRHQMYLSMSYDHRVVDGILGGSFLKRVADYLESFDLNRTI